MTGGKAALLCLLHNTFLIFDNIASDLPDWDLPR